MPMIHNCRCELAVYYFLHPPKQAERPESGLEIFSTAAQRSSPSLTPKTILTRARVVAPIRSHRGQRSTHDKLPKRDMSIWFLDGS